MVARAFAHFFSIAFHPLLLPTYAAVLMLLSDPYRLCRIESPMGVRIIGMFFIYTFVFPAFVSVVMKRLGVIDSLHMEERKQRLFPLLIINFFFFSTYFFCKWQGFPVSVKGIMLGASFSVLAAYIITVLFQKISFHAIGMGNLFTILLYIAAASIFNMYLALVIGILIAGAVGSSRLLLGAHKPREVYYGYILGFVCQFIGFVF